MEKKNRAKMLMLIGAVLLLVSFALPSTLSISPINPLVFDFDTEVSPWTLVLGGSGNAATLTYYTATSDPHPRLTCTSYQDWSGWAGASYFFEEGALTPDASYTMSFWYKSTVPFSAQYVSYDSGWYVVDQYYIECPTSSSWVQKFVEVPTIQHAAHYSLTFRVFAPGYIDFDLVQFTQTEQPPTPTVTPAPTPQPTTEPTITPTSTPAPTSYPTPQPTLRTTLIPLLQIGGALLVAIGAFEWLRFKKV